jgi:hypothetical protein
MTGDEQSFEDGFVVVALVGVVVARRGALGDLVEAHGGVRGDDRSFQRWMRRQVRSRRRLSRTSPGTFRARAISSSDHGR